MNYLRKATSFLSYYLFSALCCAFLFSVGWLWGRNRSFLYRIASHFGPFSPVPNKPTPVIPTISAGDLIGGDFDLRILEPMVANGNVTLFELMVINQLARNQPSTRCFEIGTFDGRTSLNLAANTPERAEIYTLDLPKEKIEHANLPLAPSDLLYISKDRSGDRFRGSTYQAKITQLYGDSSIFDYSPYLGSMDFVFVDGSHSYEYVLSDSDRALSLLKSNGGIILWHDYDSWTGVTTCLNKLYLSNAAFKRLRRVEGTSLVCLITGS